jgi:GntR family transcriptional regulator of gluconate operon
MLSFPSLVQQPLGDRVAHELRVRIIGGQLPRGTRLVEDVLAEQFAVSRGPIRDAFRQLEAEGLLESRRRGVFVTGLTEEDVDELYTLREALETMAVSLAMRRAAPTDWDDLRRRVDELAAAADRGDAPDFTRADLAFHSQLYQLSGHRRLRAVWEQYRPTFGVLLDVANAIDAELAGSAEAHAELLRTIRSGDEAAAVTNLRGHLRAARDRLRTMLPANRDG